MFQPLGGALLIKSHIFKQMLFPVCSCKLYSSFIRVLAYCYRTQLRSVKQILKSSSAKLITQITTSKDEIR